MSEWDQLAMEAAKAAAGNAGGLVVTSLGNFAGRLRAKLAERGRSGILGSREEIDLPALARELAELAESDPEFGAQLDDLLAAARADSASDARPSTAAPDQPFSDRDEERRTLAIREPGPGATVRIIHGPTGSGKTALTLCVAHESSEHFPDGQVYVNLADFRDGKSVKRGEVMCVVLRQFGIDAEFVAVDNPALWSQYRAALARRRFLLVLDNAESLEDVRDLVPPSPSSVVLVTTIKAQDALLAAYPSEVPLRGLPQDKACELLAVLCGHEMIAAEPGAAAALVDRCDRMPYAIRQAGVRLRKRAGRAGAISGLLQEFQRDGVLNGLGVIKDSLAATFAELSPDARELCRLLAVHPGPDFTEHSARALAGKLIDAELDELIDACFVTAHGNRLRMYNLAREYAAGRPGDTEQALIRLLGYYRDVAVAVDWGMGKDRLRRYRKPEPVPEFDGQDALGRVEAECQVFVPLVRLAQQLGRHAEVGQLCGGLERLQVHRGHHRLFVELYGLAADSANHEGTHALEARFRSQRAKMYGLLHDFPAAHDELRKAFELIPADDLQLWSSIYEMLGRVSEEQGDLPRAVDALYQAVLLDQRIADARALGLHARMLANVLVKSGRFTDAAGYLELAQRNTSEPRNASRVHTVLGKLHIGQNRPADAMRELWHAKQLADESGANQYDIELSIAFGDAAFALRDFDQARNWWAGVWRAFNDAGHPRQAELLQRLSSLPTP